MNGLRQRVLTMVAALAVTSSVVHADGWAWGVARSGGADVLSLSATNALGEAVLSDADLGDLSVDEIAFTATPSGADALTIGGIDLSLRALRFTSAVPLRANGANSAFCLTDGAWTFDGIDFRGVGETPAAPADGAAIDSLGGSLALSNCSFTNFVSRFTGGAVSARELTDDLLVTNCVFVGNKAQPINGYGGAIYASAAAGEDVRLEIVGCRFAQNAAENGGAICTLVIDSARETPVTLTVTDGPDGTTFEANEAVYEGGAVFAEGPVCLDGPATLFRANAAGWGGGAVCLSGIENDFTPAGMSVTNGVVFAENRADTDVSWTGGGAISVMLPGCTLEVCRAAFSNNLATTACDGQSAFGGAVFTFDGVTNVLRKTAFVGNAATAAAGSASFGGAVSARGGETTVDNCVFDCRGTTAVACYGSAIDFDAVQGVVSNTTIRAGATEAISSADANLRIVNCVAVGNGLGLGADALDFLFDGETTVDLSYTAYGSLAAAETATVAEAFTLPNRVATAVYDGESLRLNAHMFNPVVELGLVQPETTDFDGNLYVSTGATIAFPRPRTSMGAFVAETDRLLVLDVVGVKDYDSTTRSNGCVWTWKLTDTNGNDVVYDDLVPADLDAAAASAYLAERFAITNWVFGSEANGGAAGLYDSTNEAASAWHLAAGVQAVTDRIDWLGAVLILRARGEIENSWFVLPVDFGGGETNGVYFTWNWMKEALGRYPTNDFEESCVLLRAPEANGLPRWQNYVMGVDGSDSANRLATTYVPHGDPAAGGSRVDIVTPIATFAPPPKVGVEAEYRLYNVTHVRRGVLPETSGETWFCYATNAVPRFEDVDLSQLHYGLKDLDRDHGQCLLEIYAIFKEGEKPEGAE